MSKIINGGLYQFGAKPFEQQQFGTAGVEGVNVRRRRKKHQSRICYAAVEFFCRRRTEDDDKRQQKTPTDHIDQLDHVLERNYQRR